MTSGFVDTSVLIHLYRKHPDALAWLKAQTERRSLISFKRLEIKYCEPPTKPL
jgi:hypothetical protein